MIEVIDLNEKLTFFKKVKKLIIISWAYDEIETLVDVFQPYLDGF